MDFNYPRENRFVNRMTHWHPHYHDFILNETSDNGWSWHEISKLKYSYVFVFNDLIDAVNEHSEQGVYDELPREETKAGIIRQFKVLRELKASINTGHHESIWINDHVDIMLFTATPLPDPMIIKLTHGVNVVEFQFDLYDYIYPD